MRNRVAVFATGIVASALIMTAIIYYGDDQTGPPIVVLYPDPHYKGQPHKSNWVEWTIAEHAFSNTASSLKMKKPGFIVLYSSPDYSGMAYVVSSNGGPGADGNYPNLNDYGTDRINSYRYHTSTSTLPDLPYYPWMNSGGRNGRAGESAPSNKYYKVSLVTDPSAGGEYWEIKSTNFKHKIDVRLRITDMSSGGSSIDHSWQTIGAGKSWKKKRNEIIAGIAHQYEYEVVGSRYSAN